MEHAGPGVRRPYGAVRRAAVDCREVALELQRLAYGPVAGRVGPGLFRRNGSTIEVGRRAFVYDGESVSSQILRIEFRDERISALEDDAGTAVAVAQFEPLLIGNIFPTHGEDRLILTPEQVPALLIDSLKAVEDRRFDTHLGIDARAMLRAALANAREGGISQGGSTLTMQLVRSSSSPTAKRTRARFARR